MQDDFPRKPFEENKPSAPDGAGAFYQYGHQHWLGISIGAVLLLFLLVNPGILPSKASLDKLKQQLFGEMTLSTGVYSVHSGDDLNRLSWDTGLEIMETLDEVNHSLTTLDDLAASGNDSQQLSERAELLVALRHQRQKLTNLLADKAKIEAARKPYGDMVLMTPAYDDYWEKTQAKLSVWDLNQPAELAKN